MLYRFVWKEHFYALSDPRTNEVRYVGRTSSLLQRYRRHCCPINSDKTKVAQWERELKLEGLKPILIELEVAEFIDAPDTETELWPGEIEVSWIRHYQKLGANLLNYHKTGKKKAA